MAEVVYLGAPEGLDAAREVLGRVALIRSVEAEPARVAEAISSADALLDASMKVAITREMTAGAKYLKVVSCATTGSDHIDIVALSERGIPVYTLKEDRELLQTLTPAAELSWALLMACARRLKGAFSDVERGAWEREKFPGIMLNGRTLGLVGCGRIGGWMARYAAAFGMNIMAYDPFQQELPVGVVESDLRELVRKADFLSVHVHLSDDTRGLISRALIESCKPGLILVNTSRGAIVDEAALLDGLRSGLIGACGVDVLEGEPNTASHPLVEYARTHENMLITPHCGGFSPDAVRLVCARAAEKISAIL